MRRREGRVEERKSGGGTGEKKEQKVKYNGKNMNNGVRSRQGRAQKKTEKVSEKGKGKGKE